MLGNEEPRTSLPGEIVAHADWYDFEAKYDRGRHGAARCRRRSAEAETARVRELAVEVFALAGCSGLARCDFFVEPDGDGPGQRDQHDARLHRDQRLREAASRPSGIAYPDLCDRLVALAVERHRRARSYEF